MPADEEVSEELRTVEFEVMVPRSASGETAAISGYAVYFVCEGKEGTCRYLRSDVKIELELDRRVSD